MRFIRPLEASSAFRAQGRGIFHLMILPSAQTPLPRADVTVVSGIDRVVSIKHTGPIDLIRYGPRLTRALEALFARGEENAE